MLKIGFGYDQHRLIAGKRLFIGGVEIPSPHGAVAHSDGDVLIHAIIDSFLSSLGVGDIGQLFPDSDERYRDISSLKLLSKVKLRYLNDIEILNLDTVVILDSPRIASYVPSMKIELAKVLNIDTNQIGIKGKTSEGVAPDLIVSYAVCLYNR